MLGRFQCCHGMIPIIFKTLGHAPRAFLPNTGIQERKSDTCYTPRLADRQADRRTSGDCHRSLYSDNFGFWSPRYSFRWLYLLRGVRIHASLRTRRLKSSTTDYNLTRGTFGMRRAKAKELCRSVVMLTQAGSS